MPRTAALVLLVALALTMMGMGIPSTASSQINAAFTTQVPPPGEPSGPGCEWYGSIEMSHSARIDYNNGDFQQDNVNASGYSTPAEGDLCRGEVSYLRTMSAFVSNACYYTHVEGNGSAYYEAYVSTSGDDVGLSVSFTGDVPATGETGWGTCAEPTRTESEPATAAGWCAIPGMTWSTAQAMQAVSSTCTSQGGATNDNSTNSFEDHWTIRMRRTVCDPTVDSDGGGVGDCAEYERMSDPADPADDGGDPICDDGLDNDGDGAIDVGSDPGCSGATDESELGAAACDNGQDDDADTLVDYRPTGGDQGCTSLTDDSEVDCTSPTYSSYDNFQAFNPGVNDPRLQMEVTTEWCETTDGIHIFGTEALGSTVQSPFEFALDEGVRTFFSLHDRWKGSTVTQAASSVTATDTWDHCFGIPILGKIKWVKKFPKTIRFFADLLRAIDNAHLARIVRPIAKLLDKFADAVEFALKHGGRIGRRLAKEALNLVTDSLLLLPGKTQTDIFLVTVGVIADHQTSAKWAKEYVRSLVENDAKLLIGKTSQALEHLLGDELVCFAGWKPKVRQDLGVPGSVGTFIDRDGDYADWEVRRLAGAV